jgi:hypothetical protein
VPNHGRDAHRRREANHHAHKWSIAVHRALGGSAAPSEHNRLHAGPTAQGSIGGVLDLVPRVLYKLVDSLAGFGPQADMLRWVADYIVNRNK